MIPAALNVVFWFLASFLPFLFVQRWIHREIQTIFLLLTKNSAVSLGLFSLLFFPGVLLHETSHFLTAKLLRVQTGHFSIIPQLTADGRLRLGYVETEKADLIREALIGAAPLLTGGAAIIYLGTHNLGGLALSEAVSQQAWGALLPALKTMTRQPDFWIWFYLAFTISSTMIPSESDRKAWFPISGILVVIGLIAVFAGAGGWMSDHLVPWITSAFSTLTAIFGISLFVHLILAIPTWLIRVGINRITGLEVV